MLPSFFVTSDLHLDLVNYKTSLEISSFSMLINFEELSFTSLNVLGLFLKVFNHLEKLCSVRTNKAVN
jgi:hypothetical protein